MYKTKTFAALAMSIVALLSGGCGGGSSSGGGTPEASAVSLQVSSDSAYTDQTLDLTWAASNASGCTASGAWSGVLPAQGLRTVVVTTTGTQTFGITCTGVLGPVTGSKNVTVQHDPAKQVVVPLSVAVRPADLFDAYPAAFQAAPQQRIANNPYCAISSDEVVVPASFLGNFPLPTPAGRLPAGVMRGVGIKDYYPSNPSSANDCPSGQPLARAAYVVTLDRLVRLGVDHLWVYNYAPWKDLTRETWELEFSSLQISDVELAWLVAEAGKRGIKVFLEWQMLPFDVLGNSLSSTPSEASLSR